MVKDRLRMADSRVGRWLWITAGLVGMPVCLPAQSGLSNRLNSSPASSLRPTAETDAAAGATRSSRRAEVSYEAGNLTVRSSNSSLNQILREIARLTGMKITGGVADDRVFGTYGPAAPSVVLSTLLDGTGSNMLLVQNDKSVPTELILTPRVGGVTPPNPNAQGFNDGDGPDESVSSPPPIAPPAQPQNYNSRSPNRSGTGGIDTNPAATSPSSSSQQVVFPPIDATNPPVTGTTTPTTPDATSDGVKTPQQIFEQLQRLRQQQQQQSTTPQ